MYKLPMGQAAISLLAGTLSKWRSAEKESSGRTDGGLQHQVARPSRADTGCPRPGNHAMEIPLKRDSFG